MNKTGVLDICVGDFKDAVESAFDGILQADESGVVIAANDRSAALFGEDDPVGRPFWEALGISAPSLDAVLAEYPAGRFHTFQAGGGCRAFDFEIVSSGPSGGRDAYLILINDKSSDAARLRAQDIGRAESISAQERSSNLFDSIYRTARNALMLVDDKLTIVAANAMACEVFSCDQAQLVGSSLTARLAPSCREDLSRVSKLLKDEHVWRTESKGLRCDKIEFPLEISISRAGEDVRDLFHIVVSDLTRERQLAGALELERSRSQDMKITLRNVLHNIEDEVKEIKRDMARRVESDILPALERMAREEERDIRESYRAVIAEQLLAMAGNGQDGLSGLMLKLTPTELEVCKLIQAGRSTKEICEMTNSAFETIQTHRKNIRRKLGLKGQKVTLHAFLKSRLALQA